MPLYPCIERLKNNMVAESAIRQPRAKRRNVKSNGDGPLRSVQPDGYVSHIERQGGRRWLRTRESGVMAADWLKIKTEYINDPNTSYRKLSQKYGVSANSICKKSKEENWNEKRKQKLDSICTAVVQKTVEKTSEALSDEAAAKVRIRASMMRLAEGWFKTQEEWIGEDKDRVVDPGDFRKMVQSCVELGILDEQEKDQENIVQVIIDV